jgi:hypothetical protein
MRYIKTILGFWILFLFVTVDIILIRLAIWKIRLRKSRRFKQRKCTDGYGQDTTKAENAMAQYSDTGRIIRPKVFS